MRGVENMKTIIDEIVTCSSVRSLIELVIILSQPNPHRSLH